MSAASRTERLRRSGQVARVLARHASRDLVDASGLSEAVPPSEEQDDDPAPEAEALAADLEALGPTFVKLGQLLATRGDLLPDAHVDALERLQDDVEPVAFAEVRAIVEAELGAGIEARFARFDPEPLASASLGQVHRATTRDGRDVAVKVQRPGIRETVAEDLEILHGMAARVDEHTEVGARYHLDEIVDEFEQSLGRELDYRQEASSLAELRENLARLDRVVVPACLPELTTSRVLTMEHIEGEKVTELDDARLQRLDGPGLVDALFHAYLQQMLSDGFVHADPHPGNVLVTDDDRLALIDLGMVVHLDPGTRERMLRLLVAVSEGDVREAADVSLALGQRTAFFDEEAFRADVSTLITSYHAVPDGRARAGELLTEMTRISGRDGVRPPTELTLLGRTLLALDQVAGALAPGFDADAAIRRYAGQVLQRLMVSELSPGSMLRGLLDTKEFVEHLPRRANAILSSLAEGTTRVQVDAVDADRVVDALHRAANRMVVGLVLAALIVGAAMMAGVETQATILGYPALALIFFVVAAVLGLWLVIGILRGD